MNVNIKSAQSYALNICQQVSQLAKKNISKIDINITIVAVSAIALLVCLYAVSTILLSSKKKNTTPEQPQQSEKSENTQINVSEPPKLIPQPSEEELNQSPLEQLNHPAKVQPMSTIPIPSESPPQSPKTSPLNLNGLPLPKFASSGTPNIYAPSSIQVQEIEFNVLNHSADNKEGHSTEDQKEIVGPGVTPNTDQVTKIVSYIENGTNRNLNITNPVVDTDNSMYDNTAIQETDLKKYYSNAEKPIVYTIAIPIAEKIFKNYYVEGMVSSLASKLQGGPEIVGFTQEDAIKLNTAKNLLNLTQTPKKCSVKAKTLFLIAATTSNFVSTQYHDNLSLLAYHYVKGTFTNSPSLSQYKTQMTEQTGEESKILSPLVFEAEPIKPNVKSKIYSQVASTVFSFFQKSILSFKERLEAAKIQYDVDTSEEMGNLKLQEEPIATEILQAKELEKSSESKELSGPKKHKVQKKSKFIKRK